MAWKAPLAQAARPAGVAAARLVLAGLVFAAACQRGPAASGAPATELQAIRAVVGHVPLPKGALADQPWAAHACKPGALAADTLACVNGVAVTRAQFDAIASSYPPATPPRAIVQALVDEELLTAAAAKSLWGDAMQDELQRILVARLVEKQFERELSAKDVTDEDLARAWDAKAVRQQYIHPGVYNVTDAQIICCKGDVKSCSDSAEAQKCVDEMAPLARTLADFLNADPPRTRQEMHGRVGADPRFAKAAVADVAFFYNPDRPYAQQQGLWLMVESFVMATLALKPGQLAKDPVRSPFGWHVIRLESSVPPSTKGIEDPQVRELLRKDLAPALREAKLMQLTEQLGKAAELEVHLDAFGQ